MFDFDGTLVNTMHSYAKIASEEIETLYEISSKYAYQLYLETSGVPFFQQLNMIFGVDSRNRKCADKFEERKARLLSKVKLDESVKKLLYEIRSLGMSIAITSNNFQELIDNFIARESGFFDLVLGFGNGLSKGPSQFTRVMDTFGVDRRYLIFVGDSLSDARRALAFGIDFVAVSGTLKKESFTSIFPSIYVIDELTELYYLLLSKMPLIQDKGPL